MSQQKPLDQDEKIAVIVAFSVIGAILFWGFTRPQNNFQQSLFSQETPLEKVKAKEVPKESLRDSSNLVDNHTEKKVIVEKKETITPDYSTTTKTEVQQKNTYVPPAIKPLPQIQPTPLPQPTPTDKQSNLQEDKTVTQIEENVNKTETQVINPETLPKESQETEKITPSGEETQQTPTPEVATKITNNFIDVPETYWAYPFIQALQKDQILTMTEDQKYNPDATISREEYGQLLAIAFQNPEQREAKEFKDIGEDDEKKIDSAVKQKFLSGYPDDTFKPNDPISRVHVLLSLVNGLELTGAGNQQETLGIYEDQTEIPDYAKSAVAVATEKGLVVQKPNTKQLNPNQSATRAEVAAMIYQVLIITQGKPPINSEYLVKFSQNN